jgi:hypothetical protein
VNADDISLHDILDTGIHIGKENRGLESEFVEGKVDALVGISTTRGYGAFHSGGALKLCISDRGADRVHIRVTVSYDERFHL